MADLDLAGRESVERTLLAAIPGALDDLARRWPRHLPPFDGAIGDDGVSPRAITDRLLRALARRFVQSGLDDATNRRLRADAAGLGRDRGHVLHAVLSTAPHLLADAVGGALDRRDRVRLVQTAQRFEDELTPPPTHLTPAETDRLLRTLYRTGPDVR